MNEADAIKFLKSIIDSELMAAPQIIYYDNASKLQISNVSYEEFKKYIEVIKARSKVQDANEWLARLLKAVLQEKNRKAKRRKENVGLFFCANEV